jgi:glycosyltransferase involved in cell wall biosynthesis
MQLYKLAASRCDLLMYVCERQRQYWRRRGLRSANDAVEHNAIDVGYFAEAVAADTRVALRARLGFSSEDYVIGLCAALRPEKAHGDLLAALASLRAAGLPAKALLIGEGPERARIEHAAAAKGLTEHVRLTGFQRDVRPYIAVCDVMTLVSHAVETFSLAALESMACGKPLVMSDIGGASEQIVHGESGLLYPPGDLDALAAHLTRLTAPGLRTSMGAAAAERVRRCFTLKRMVAGFERRFDELLHGAQPWLIAATSPRGDSPEG